MDEEEEERGDGVYDGEEEEEDDGLQLLPLISDGDGDTSEDVKLVTLLTLLCDTISCEVEDVLEGLLADNSLRSMVTLASVIIFEIKVINERKKDEE